MDLMCSQGSFLLRRVKAKLVNDVDPANDEYPLIDLDFAAGLSDEPTFAGRNCARFQRATEGASQSTGRGGNHIVQRCRMRCMFGRVGMIELGYFGVHAEENRVLFDWQIGASQGTLDPFDLYGGGIDHFGGHRNTPFLKLAARKLIAGKWAGNPPAALRGAAHLLVDDNVRPVIGLSRRLDVRPNGNIQGRYGIVGVLHMRVMPN